MSGLVKGFECFEAWGCIVYPASFFDCGALIVASVHEQCRALERRGVVHRVVLETVKSMLLSAPENQHLSTWEGGYLHGAEAIPNGV